MPIRLAACVRGQLTASCSGDPAQVSLCHCLACQRRTGSTYGIAAFFPRDSVMVAGDTKAYTRSSDSGYAVTFYFCPHCGSTVYWSPELDREVKTMAEEEALQVVECNAGLDLDLASSRIERQDARERRHVDAGRQRPESGSDVGTRAAHRDQRRCRQLVQVAKPIRRTTVTSAQSERSRQVMACRAAGRLSVCLVDACPCPGQGKADNAIIVCFLLEQCCMGDAC
jgi:hypothetical protein